MPLLDIDRPHKAVSQQCPNCGLISSIAFTALTVDDTISTPPCPNCNAVESFRVNIPDFEVGQGNHTGSLKGRRFADTGGVVTDHTMGYSLDHSQIATRNLYRQLAQAVHAAQQGQGQGHTP